MRAAGRHRIDVWSYSSADPARVYELVADGTSWPVWSPLGSFELAEPGEDGAEGLGAVRVFRTRFPTGQVTSRERIVELVPRRRLSYTLEHGLAIRNYRADIDLSPTGAGTTIHWHSTFDSKVPGTGWLYRLALRRFIGQCAHGLARHAAKS
ncbi:MAG: SRPBCC family protein [Sciscionella sp.]